MSRARTVFQRFSLLSAVPVLLLLPLAGCGGRTDESGQAGNREEAGPRGGEEAERPVAPQDQNQGRGRRREAKAHMTLTGALQFDADLPMACAVYPDKGLQFTFDQTGERAPQVQVRITDYVRPGEYPASVMIREHPESGPVREWNGSAKIDIQSRTVGGARKRTAFNGTFNGTYEGAGGKGTLSGQFRRCVLTGMDQ